MSRESSRLIFSSSPPFYEYSFQSIVAVEDTPYDIAQRRKKVLLNYILCIRFISKMYSIVNVSQFSYTNLSQFFFEWQSRFFLHFPGTVPIISSIHPAAAPSGLCLI